MDTLFAFIRQVRSRRWLAITLGAVLLSIVLITEVVVPRGQAAYRTYRTWKQQAASISSAQNWERQMARLTASQTVLRDRLDSLFVSLPQSDQMSAVLDVLQQKARASGVSILQVRPASRQTYDTYEELPIDVAIRGQFHPVARFVDRVERSQYLMNVQRASLESSGMTNDTLQVNLRIDVVTLMTLPDSTAQQGRQQGRRGAVDRSS